ncbi:MAG: sulfur oxidation c-type cytochrome SoxX [Bradyrhizobiaceae bacterium]|nr:sulfur oxidation c-type cytochrome SoxX [Bradyrhizobiaceae bacterium]
MIGDRAFSSKVETALQANARPLVESGSRPVLKRIRSVVLALGLFAGATVSANPQNATVPYTIVGDAIPASLIGSTGDADRGRAIVANRQVGLCLMCHSGPLPEVKLQGNLAPDLKGAGARWNEGQLRLRIVDASEINSDTIMPPYYRVDGLVRVANSFRNKPILTAEQIEDVVAYLVTLRD